MSRGEGARRRTAGWSMRSREQALRKPARRSASAASASDRRARRRRRRRTPARRGRTVRSRLEATRCAKVAPSIVTTGTPTQSASPAVVWALHGQASRYTSARARRLRWPSSGSSGAKTRRSAPMPRSAAACGQRRLHVGVPLQQPEHRSRAAACSSAHQRSNTSAEILYDWWKAHSSSAPSRHAPVGAGRRPRQAHGARRSAGSNAAAGRSSRRSGRHRRAA